MTAAVRHIVIIGAARSGTKMLRSALATATGAGVVPYDIGYVWRAGNERLRDDVIAPGQLDQRGRELIQRFVDGYAAGAPPVVIEKTVGNTLRVPFVASVFPDAKYIHLLRDGVDVVESARRQWTAGSDWRYIAAKARHVPLRLAPRFGAGYAASLGARMFSRDRRVGSWGPRYPGMEGDLRTEDLLVVCARQWRESVLAATRAFEDLRFPVYEVRYEDLVSDSVPVLRKLTEFLEVPAAADDIVAAAETVRGDRVSSGRAALLYEELAMLVPEFAGILAGLGYAPVLDSGAKP